MVYIILNTDGLKAMGTQAYRFTNKQEHTLIWTATWDPVASPPKIDIHEPDPWLLVIGNQYLHVVDIHLYWLVGLAVTLLVSESIHQLDQSHLSEWAMTTLSNHWPQVAGSSPLKASKSNHPFSWWMYASL